MYRLLIVDDERYIVESLYELFAEQNDIELDIRTAYYGDSALQILRNNKVDLVFLDIKMPGMSGIDVAREITMNWPSCHIIILTGYASFDYIYEIKKLKNTSFILKTEDNETIVATLRQAITDIETQKLQQQLYTQAEKNQLHLSYLIHADILRDLICGKSPVELKDFLPRSDTRFPFDMTKPVFLFYLKVKWENSVDFNIELHQNIVLLTAYFFHGLNEKYHVFILDVDACTFTLFVQPNAENSLSMDVDHNTYIKECLNDCVTGEYPSPIAHMLLLCQEKETLWYQIANVYDFYVQYYFSRLIPSFVEYDRTVICFDDEGSMVTQDNKCVQANTHVYFSRLANGLQAGDLTEINDVLDYFHQYLKQIGSIHRLPTISLFHRASSIYTDLIMQYRLKEKILPNISLYKLYNLDQFQTSDELISYYRQLSALLVQQVAEGEQDSRMRTIAIVKSYIQNNIHRSLSLYEIANAANYNGAYLSRLFHQMTGESISQYILRIKMEKAEYYLLHSNEKIQSIAEKLGFETAQYFSSVYKRHTGLSPRDYRNRSIQ